MGSQNYVNEASQQTTDPQNVQEIVDSFISADDLKRMEMKEEVGVEDTATVDLDPAGGDSPDNSDEVSALETGD